VLRKKRLILALIKLYHRWWRERENIVVLGIQIPLIKSENEKFVAKKEAFSFIILLPTVSSLLYNLLFYIFKVLFINPSES
jgi:hypothetical protein